MKRLGFVFFLVFVGLLLAGALAALNQMRQPLGPALELSGAAAAITPTSATTSNTSTRAPSACPGEGAVNLLVLGLASPETPGQRGADAIRLVRLDFDRPGVAILSLPPDLLIGTTELTSLTRLYWQAHQENSGADNIRHQQATRALAQALLDNYGFAADHYITVNQPAFARMIDALGGIQVNVPEAILDVPEGWHSFQAGEQTMTGDQALDYVRLLNPSNQTYPSEWNRFARQNLVIRAALSAALKPTNWDQLPNLVNEFNNLLVTDLSAAQLLEMTCLVQEVGDQARLLELPFEKVSASGQLGMIVDPASVRSLIGEMAGE